MVMNHFYLGLTTVLIASAFAGVMTWMHSIGTSKGYKKQMVFLDHLFFICICFACTLVYKDADFNADALDILAIGMVFYIVIWRVPKWGVIK